MSTSERETMIRIRVLSLVPAPWTSGSAKITTKNTRHDFCPEQNEVSHLHGLVQPLRKVARSVFNTLDWNGKANMISVNTLIYPSKNFHHCKKKRRKKKKVPGWNEQYYSCISQHFDTFTANPSALLIYFWSLFEVTVFAIWVNALVLIS